MPVVQLFQRTPEEQAAFDRAKVILRQRDTVIDPTTGAGSMNADLVLEGGGVKGIGVVGAMLVHLCSQIIASPLSLPQG